MPLKYGTIAGLVVAAFVLGLFVGQDTQVGAQEPTHVFELRTYTAPPGKLDALVSRFRDHTDRLFSKHGMKSLGYWIPTDAPASENTLVYILQHESREAATQAWIAFREDPEWQRVAEETQRDGRIVSNVESVFMAATDFSAIR